MTRRDRILNTLASRGAMSARDLSVHLEEPLPVIASTLSKLKGEGALVKSGRDYTLPGILRQIPKAKRLAIYARAARTEEACGDVGEEIDARLAGLKAHWTAQAELAARRLAQIAELEGLRP